MLPEPHLFANSRSEAMKTMVKVLDRIVDTIQTRISTTQQPARWPAVKAEWYLAEFGTRTFIGRRLGLALLSLRIDGLAHARSKK
jgi:hypothetical protein